MATKWNALTLGLAATVIFSAGETQAQGIGDMGVLPAEVSVTRDGSVFNFSSSLIGRMDFCEFEFPIHIFDIDLLREFPVVGTFGALTFPFDGSLTVDRSDLLATLDLTDARFASFCTSCGINQGITGAKALLARIQVLEDGESVTLHTVFFDPPDCGAGGCCTEEF